MTSCSQRDCQVLVSWTDLVLPVFVPELEVKV